MLVADFAEYSMFRKPIFIIIVLLMMWSEGLSQCNNLRPQIDIRFNTDQDCAPVSVTQFMVTYYFNVPQDPATIAILYEWNDPTEATTLVDAGSGLIVGSSPSGPNTTFTANATFVYTDNNNACNITPTTYVVIDGVVCFTSQQVQTAFYWDTDNEGNGVVQMAPREWEVCFDNPVVDARFIDASEFNCNIAIEPDNPNRSARHVQFVYGTNHNPANAIRNLTLEDGGTQNLTDGTGALSTSTTRGSGAVLITGSYFGPVETIPFPADGPNAVSFPMNAPADPANAIGDRFQVTLFNWNVCNPWNGDPVNPNYEDAIITTAHIIIVESPNPDFYTEDQDGNVVSDFCIDELITFRNTTANANDYNYAWEFYDDATGTDLVHTSTQRHPKYAFSSGGTKLIRLRATNPTAQSPCVEEFVSTVNITPSMVAAIGVTDLNDAPITAVFCQEAEAPLTPFDVRFRDISGGTSTPTTERRWEFFDENGSLVFESPSGGGFAPGVAGPFDRVFVNAGVYTVVLTIRDNVTGCESVDEAEVRVYRKPMPDFTATEVCETFATTLTDVSAFDPVAAEQIVSREWDMDFDGVNFTPDPALNDEQTFDYVFPAAGTYRVALRIVTDLGSCEAISEKEVTVNPLPLAAFSPDRTSGCSALVVNFSNEAINGQPDEILEYRWEVDAGMGFETDSVQRPSDPGFGSVFSRIFVNHGSTSLDYQVRLRVVTVHGCERVSPPETITVYPAPRSGFVSLDYSPFNENCSPVAVSFEVDAETIAMNPTEFIWTISDANGVIAQENTGTTPAYDHMFVNSSQSIQDYFVTLRATLPSGCSGDSTRIIRVNPVPSSDFDIDTVSVSCDRIVLRFSALQKALNEYDWTVRSNGTTLVSSSSLGDAFDFEVIRASTAEQTIEATLETENFANCSGGPTTKTARVGPAENINASFTASPSLQQFPASTVILENMTNAGAWTYHWDFGDGTTSSSADVASYTYGSWGTYTITLTVTGSNCEEERAVTIEILPPAPVPDFSYDPPSGCAPLTVNFTNLSVYADPAAYAWDFGDGSVSNAVNPTHVYHDPGVYTVTLAVSNAAGEEAQVVKQDIIEVFQTPLAQFNVKPLQVAFPGGVLYTDNQSFGATSFLWDFGDGTTSTLFEPEHIYETEGVFTVSLTVTNAEGCADTRTFEAGVRTIRTGQMLVPNAFSPNLFGPGASGGQNDVFRPVLQGVTEFQMLVFNRWGQLLFETTDPMQGWDGYYQGKLCQQDVYVYKIVATYANGQEVVKVGDIHLMR